ncbi:GNAT family N-acetyltransferase [Tenuibacillus multivorans]|nr:GNAT family N-acetyltransferase [Tenuibacillus multivorans]GEL76445.1 N-acetyltransferase [Tenuibacillus multivorans]
METVRCQLNRLEEKDLDEVFRLFSNERVRQYLGGTIDEQAFRGKFQALLTDETSWYWVVRLKHHNDFIGLVSLDKHHDQVSTEVSYQLLPEAWGQGVATEVIQKMINYAFEELSIARLVAETQSANLASCRLLEKVGMKLEQTVERFGAEQKIYKIDGNEK